eukprot:8729174-Pyramimonas_sp.AAC.1
MGDATRMWFAAPSCDVSLGYVPTVLVRGFRSYVGGGPPEICDSANDGNPTYGGPPRGLLTPPTWCYVVAS